MQKHGGGNVNASNLSDPNLGYFGTQCGFETQSRSSSRLSLKSYPTNEQGHYFISLFDSQLNSNVMGKNEIEIERSTYILRQFKEP